jgi:HPt (histidine-containing phosphotransfer) domain-containing protein
VSVSDRATPSNALVSELLVEDPDLRDLVEEFVDGLTERAAEFRQAFEELDWDKLARLAHQLKGAAGSYGYPDLGSLGATMEAGFSTRSADQFTDWMAQLEELIGAAHKGLQAG